MEFILYTPIEAYLTNCVGIASIFYFSSSYRRTGYEISLLGIKFGIVLILVSFPLSIFRYKKETSLILFLQELGIYF